MDKFNLENQYQMYLQRVGITEDQMHPVQRVETKRAFMGAAGQMLDLFTNEITEYDDDKAMEIISDLFNQTSTYWIKETGQAN